MPSQYKHRNIFTHGDLRLANIKVKDGHVTGILDWEFSGWYPEYCEFAKALHIWKWRNDWTDYMVQIFKPYCAEYGAYQFLTEVLW
ncbi:uncharacterized protein ASPGLDRAFT_264381 [Aspergillus glaucus CBS 516.65]|uniref:Aminoglycoside phosphotransferase domain-containing protein n=1 Tax=Aspergillus glaucus CBS 516.65 TaxID=1160497 RepID=A0A1L9W083_ASPGL|nr:hypothetical protein ASPGLDRAFT_264381 [Aspergillus glaucus CBS 516.65]OJJ89571.1 hypothetical protein ASPGLDRAFT_264381 [Aspergillus glaucus CBS 516.65]